VVGSENEQYGDLVSGTYDRTATAHLEDNQYNRTDFSASVGATSTSFLVRLRRTNDFQSLDDVNGVSSNSPTLPLLFGRTNVYHDPNSQTNPNGYSPRRDGLAVRATAIADARQVLRVGSSTSGMPGVAPFAIDIAQISPAFSNPLILNPQGSTDFVAFNTAPGSVVNVGVCTLNVNVVGNQVAGSLCSLLPGNFYLPIYTSQTSVPLIVGFVYVQIDAGINLHQTSSLASGSATALVPSGFLAGVSQSDRLILQQQTQQLQGMALLAPVLVR
jgi:hypothetical protein